jgi:hypothetical protein
MVYRGISPLLAKLYRWQRRKRFLLRAAHGTVDYMGARNEQIKHGLKAINIFSSYR